MLWYMENNSFNIFIWTDDIKQTEGGDFSGIVLFYLIQIS